VEARLIERDARPHREARATAIQPGTLEILESIGLLPPFLGGPRPGQRYPDWTRLVGTSHRALVFGPVTEAESLAQLDRRWSKLVQISRDPDVDPVRADLPARGVILIRPDGHIGFRFPSAQTGALAALDRHLSSYLIPDPAVAPLVSR